MTSPLVKLQEDVLAKLNAESFFADITVKSVRKLQIQSELEQKLVHLTAKGGKMGIGVLIGMPTISVDSPNAPGPSLIVTQPVRVIEDPMINMSAKGTQKSAEDVAMQILRTLHLFAIENLVCLYGDKNAIQPNTEFDQLLTYDVFLQGRLSQNDLGRAILPNLSEEELLVTLTNLTADAAIYYTANETFPSAQNPDAVLYDEPFVVAPGTILRWAAYKDGLIGSDVGEATIN